MDTLPLNGNFNNSYSLRNGDYGDSVQVVDCGLSLDDAAFEKMIISELVQNNLRAKNHQHHQHQHHHQQQQQHQQQHHHHQQQQQQHQQQHHHQHQHHHQQLHVERVPPRVPVGGSSSEDDAIVADASSLVHGVAAGLELEAPLIPQRTHSLLYQPQKRLRAEGDESYVSQLTAGPDAGLHSPNRDSLYTSMPNLRDSPLPQSSPGAQEELASPSKRSDNEDVYYKSMPNLGAGHQLHAYYQISRGNSDGYIIPVTKEDCLPEGEVREGQMQLVTSL